VCGSWGWHLDTARKYQPPLVQGDVLLAINQQQINAANAADTIASQLCKGPAGSLVEVQFSRGILGQVSGQNCSNFLSRRALSVLYNNTLVVLTLIYKAIVVLTLRIIMTWFHSRLIKYDSRSLTERRVQLLRQDRAIIEGESQHCVDYLLFDCRLFVVSLEIV